MCRKMMQAGVCSTLALVLMVVAATFMATSAWAQPNPALNNGVDCATIRAGAQSDEADPRWEDDNTDFAINCPGVNPLGWGFDYAHAWIWVEPGTDALYVCVDTYGIPGDADADGGYASTAGAQCGTDLSNLCGTSDGIGGQVFSPSEELNIRIDRDCDGNVDLIFRISNDQLQINLDVFTPGVGLPATGRGEAWEIAPDVADGPTLFGTPECADPRLREGAVVFTVPNFAEFFTGDLIPGAFNWKVSGGHADDQLSEDSIEDSILPGLPAIDIVKTASKDLLCNNGDTVDFTLTVTNTGTTPIENVTVTDVLPAGLDYTSVGTCGFGVPTVVGSTITWDLGTMDAGAVLECTFTATSSGCVGTVRNNAEVTGDVTNPCLLGGGPPVQLFDSDFADVVCAAPCVDVRPADDIRACAGTDVCITFVVENCGPETADIDFQGMFNGANVAANPTTANVGAGQTVEVQVCGTLPADCTTVPVMLTATTGLPGVQGCEASDDETAIVLCDTPEVMITKDDGVAPDSCVADGAVVTYTLTVTNIGDTDLENIQVIDTVEDLAVYSGGSATPRGDTLTVEPTTGATGLLQWDVPGSLAPGGTLIFTFDVILSAPEGCEGTATHTNAAAVEAFCADARATDTATHQTCIDCIEIGYCWMTTGGFQNAGFKSGPKDDNFGGNVGPPPHGSWQHIQRHGNNILFNFHSHDVHVVRCYHDGGDGPCHPGAEFNVIEYDGTGFYSMGPGSRDYPATFFARAEDHGEPGNRPNKDGGCGSPDYYYIEVRNADTGEIVFTADDFLDGGNIQIHPFKGNQERKLDGDRFSTGGAEATFEIGPNQLYRAFPNPFTQATRIAYAVEGISGEFVNLGIFDVAGRQVRQLVGEIKNPGSYEVTWNGRNDEGIAVPTGMYFLRATIGGQTQPVSRIMYLK